MNRNKLFNGFEYENEALHLPRNIFPMHPSHDTSCNLGEIKPIYLVETMPGASYNFKKIVSQTIMPSPLKHPMLSELHQDIHVFFVPFRIIWDKYKSFEGNPEPSAWNESPQGTYSTPQLDFASCPVQAGDIGNMLGLPIGFTGIVSALPFRAFAKIYNYFYRDENVEVSQNTYFDLSTTLVRYNIYGTGDRFTNLVNKGAKTPFLSDEWSYSSDVNKNAIATGGWCPHAYKLRDFWQTLLPKPQKGEPVTISLTGDVPLNTTDNITSFSSNQPLAFGSATEISHDSPLIVGSSSHGGTVAATNSGSGVAMSNLITGSNLVADLSTVSVISIDALKTAISIQGVMAKLAHSGTRYDEWLLAIFGEKVPDFRIDEPECIGGFRRRLNVGTVLQSSNVTSQSTPTGTMYGYSNTVNGKDNLGVFTAKERGYIIVCSVIRSDNRYTQGVNQLWKRKTRFDYAFPPLANLPDEAHYQDELYYQAGAHVLGYSERYGSYKFMESRLSGMLDPVGNLALSNWTASEVLTSAPTLTPSWKKSLGIYLDRCLTYPHFIVDPAGTVTGLGPDQFIISFYMELEAHLPLPIHPKPYRF